MYLIPHVLLGFQKSILGMSNVFCKLAVCAQLNILYLILLITGYSLKI